MRSPAPCLQAWSTVKSVGPQRIPFTAKRSFHHTPQSLFIDDLLKVATGNGTPRVLAAKRKLPYSVPALFKIVASIDAYPDFLPFLQSSRVSSRDQKGWPSRATMDVGYAGYKESFTSQVDCDETMGIVRARSGDSVEDDQYIKDEGLFKTLDTIWKFSDVTSGRGSETEAALSVKVKFRNPMYDALLAAVETKVASAMIEAFEQRLKETGGR